MRALPKSIILKYFIRIFLFIVFCAFAEVLLINIVNSRSDPKFLNRDDVIRRYILDDFNDVSEELITTYQNFVKYEEASTRKVDLKTSNSTDKEQPPCPEHPPDLQGQVDVESHPPSWSEIAKANPKISTGGRYFPSECKARYRVAIIIPLRGRETQLRVLLAHMHPIWQRQLIDYTVYVVTQFGEELFNRAKLMNVGFVEANKERKYDCYVFHDVDLLLENDKCLYWCSDDTRHIAKYIDKFGYQAKSYKSLCSPLQFTLHSIHLFGGVSMMSHKQFNDVNGYSNLFWGWGGEDDDMYLRLWMQGYSASNPYGKDCSFHMIEHKHERSNAKNDGRFALLNRAISRMKYEGLSTLRYKLNSIKTSSLFTNITVDVGVPSSKMKRFMNGEGKLGMCIAKLPWSYQ